MNYVILITSLTLPCTLSAGKDKHKKSTTPTQHLGQTCVITPERSIFYNPIDDVDAFFAPRTEPVPEAAPDGATLKRVHPRSKSSEILFGTLARLQQGAKNIARSGHKEYHSATELPSAKMALDERKHRSAPLLPSTEDDDVTFLK